VAPAAAGGASATADPRGLTPERLRAFLRERHALLALLGRQPELVEPVWELTRRARHEPGHDWESAAREPRLAARLRGAVGPDPVAHFRLHALVSAVFERYAAQQSLAELEGPAVRRELDRARALAADARTTRGKRDHARQEVARIDEARQKLRRLLGTGLPAGVSALVARHERELTAALEEPDPEEAGLEPAPIEDATRD
jgi:hypothetical protein